MASTLPIPWISQLTAGAQANNNDCGAASGLMILKAYNPSLPITVDQFYNQTGASSDRYLSASEIMAVMSRYSVTSRWYSNSNIEALFGVLRNRRPVIALVNYGVLVSAGYTETVGFRGSHFLVVTGMDINTVYVNDPYWRSDRGANNPLPIAVFDEAWRRTSEQQNPAYGMIAADNPIGSLQPSLFRVRILSPMNIRNGAGTNFDDIGDLGVGAIVNVVETNQAGDWARFADGKWVYIGNPTWTQRL